MPQAIAEHAALLQECAVIGLAVMAVCVAVIAIQKTINAHRMKSSSLLLLSALADNLRHQRIQSTIDVCKGYRDSHVAKVIVMGMLERQRCEMYGMPDATLTLAVGGAMDRSVALQVLEWKEHLGLVDAIGRTAPFVGVVAGNAAGVAAGTLLSLLTIWLGTFFKSRGDGLEVEMKGAAGEMKQFLSAHAKCQKCRAESRNLHYDTGYTCPRCCPKCQTA
ncbi:MAG TPA: hypothetical protein VHX14_09325 [Thermoanaerobaculia bacterium]|jgi:hypothetical protein|nr:hypothetical protein [Thermoanaerobaculia bacterium]